jgi:sugar phosphate isomerase/epimerase
MSDDWQSKVKELKAVADDLGMEFVQMHSPAFETLETLDPNENWDEKLAQTIRSIEMCKLLDIPMTVVHAGVKRNTSKEETIELNKQFYQLLVPAMEETGTQVLVENAPVADNQGRYYLNNGARLKEFLDYFNHPLLRACWDVGHGNYFGAQYDDILTVGKYISAIHYNDNVGGPVDMHTIPFMGTLNNDEVVRALIEIKFSGPFTFEATGKGAGIRNFSNNNDREIKLSIIRALEVALYQTGKLLLNKYNIFEE